MYQVGDWIFYGNTGACQVTDVSERKLPGMEQEMLYYTLRPLEDSCSISTPANGKIFTRPLITREEAEALIDAIPEIDAQAYHNPVLRQLSEHYEKSLNTHDCLSLIKMTMSIHAKKEAAVSQKKKLGAVDEKFMKRAEDLLFGELSVALGIRKAEVADYIARRLAE
jgi:CarD family transcriptional regulator